ncbi:MAG TPA: carboxypeptidase-like regulatory domain-containing protein [Terriglobales bacterium]|nr:carboxypeptidase-like regulatory domain-containing protein [Terriglobales bacterium]
MPSRQLTSVLILFVLCLFVPFLQAQSTNTGIVSGTVTDPSGAVVSGATVTLTDVATSTSRTASTNNAGHYVLVNVPPGRYDLTITKQGFSKSKAPLNVEVGQATTFDTALQVGGSSVVVEVTAATNELQTMNATIGNTVTGQALENLPTLGRDTSSFVTMQPGVSPDGSAAGTVVDQAVFMLDGGNNSNDMDGSSGVYNPNFGDDPAGGLFSNKYNQISGAINGINGGQPSGVMPTPVDSVEEFKVATTNQTADFNNSSGLQVQIVTKRGSNTWHGTAYEYYLDNNFSANTWDNNQATPKIPVPDWHRNWFGGAVGGPIIPKEILGGKTYAFFNYQGARWPNSETITKLVPSVDMRNGILHDLNNPSITYNLNTLDPRRIGINSYLQQLWNKYMPLPTPGAGCGSLAGGGYCDGVNTLAFRANLSLPQNDNFAVVRLDHDFGEKWHFQASYRYYHLTRATDDQVDIGGFFPGDTLGTPASLTNRPQVPWYLVLGMTTNVNVHVTNDFRYSFLRNWWQWGSHGDPPQYSNLGAALEPLGEETPTQVAAPYNVNNQQTRTRFWNGRDHFFRDDVSWLKGSHLFQFGGQYQHNWNYHSRTDNGGTINYYPVYQIGDTAGAGTVDMSSLGSAFSNAILAREAAAVLGIVTDTQQVYTYSVSGSNLLRNPPLTPAYDRVTIPYYNLYMNDTWRLKPSLTFTYGLGWALEMPATEQNGKQILLVDSTGRQIDTQSYLAQRQQAALQGLVYNPLIGFGLIDSVIGHPSYMYDPYYHAFSPRIAIAWNPDLGDRLGRKNTVFRGGYGRIYGRLNGVGLVLAPLLSPGLIYPASCGNVFRGGPNGSCGTSGPDLNTAFRIGTDGTSPVIPVPAATVTQPSFPGVNGNATAATAAPLDPKTRPNSVDSFDLTIQHQFSNKVSVEVGGISRWIHSTLLSVNLNSVPYMMTLGGQQFQAAYANLEKAMGCATSIAACQAAKVGMTVAPQPFFEAALAGTGFPCTPSCTQGLVNNAALFGDLQGQQVYSLWTTLDTGGKAPGFNFPASTLFGSGQISSNVLASTSLGHGNYNAAFATLKFNDWHGVTLQNNLTFSRALGTGDVIQATSDQGVVDPFNFNTQYGPQPSDRKLVDTMFVVYQEPFYRGQQGILGHILGGWTPSFVFTAGSGAPLFCATYVSFGLEGYSGAQEFGSADGIGAATDANCVLGGGPPSASFHNLNGVYTAFGDPTAVYGRLRPLILGYDTRSSGYGAFRGLKYWNLNFGIKKNIKITERFNAEASLNVNNILNHNQLLDPVLGVTSPPASFGQFSIEGTTPRTMEMGIRVNF